MADGKKTAEKNRPNTNFIVLGVWLAIVVVIIGAYFLFLQPKSSFPPTAGNNSLNAEINQLNKRLADNPNDIQSLIRLGQDYNKEKRYDSALGVFQMALKVDSSDTVALVNMAYTKISMGKGEEAGPFLDKALKIKPDYDFAKFINAIYLSRIKQDYPAALKILAGLKKQINDTSKLTAIDNLITQIKQAQSQAESSSATPNNSNSK